MIVPGLNHLEKVRSDVYRNPRPPMTPGINIKGGVSWRTKSVFEICQKISNYKFYLLSLASTGIRPKFWGNHEG